MQKLTTKQAYFVLQSKVCDLLPPDAAAQVIRRHEHVLLSRVNNTISGATKDLPLLIMIVETCLPSFTIDPVLKALA